MSEKTVQEIMDEAQEKFGEGWAWGLVSTLSPGVIRIQLHSDGEEEDMMRRCVESPTFEEAVAEAIKFTNENDVNECIKESMENMFS